MLGISERVITKQLILKNFKKFLQLFPEGMLNEPIKKFFYEINYEIPQEDNNLDKKSLESDVRCVKLISAPAFTQKKIEVKDFIKHFRSRFEIMKTFFETMNFENLSSIRKIGDSQGNYTVIASVFSKRITKNKNLLIEIEDLTGNSVVLVNHNKKEVFEMAKDLLKDDIVSRSQFT